MTQNDLPDDHTIGMAGGKGSPLVVRRSSFKGIQTVDIRKYFREKSSGDLKPTRKGLTLTRNQYLFLHSIFEERHDDLVAWLDRSELTDGVPSHARDFSKHVAHEKKRILDAANVIDAGERSVSSRHDEWSSPETLFCGIEGQR